MSKQSSGVVCGAVSDGNTVTLCPQGSPHKFTLHPWPYPPPHVIEVVNIVVSQNVYDDSRSSMRIAWREFGTEELKVTWVTTDDTFVAEMKRLFQRKADGFCSIEQTDPVWKYRVWDYDGDGYFRLERASLRGGVWREDRYDCEVWPTVTNLWCDTPEQAIDEYRKRRQQDVARLQAEIETEIETEIGYLTKQAEDMR